MSSKLNRPQRRLDGKDGVTLGGGGIIETGGGAPSPGIVILTAPQSFTIVSTALAASLLVPKAIANTTWKRPLAPGPVGSYLIQWSLSSSFTTPTGIPVPGTQTSAAIGDLPCGLTVYFRIAAIAAGGVQGAWSATVSILTPSDTTPPAAPTSLTTAWSGLTGDLDIRWTNPTSANFAYVRIQIYASNGGALLRTEKSVTGRYVWSRAQQYADTAGAYDPSVYLVLTSVSVGGILSATTLTGTATLSVPGTPSGLTTNWASDTGTAAADCLITWTASAGVALYRLSIDGVAHDVVGGRYLYTFDNNRAEHSGTPDAALSLSLVAVDALGQSSTAATTTATNAAPPATTISAFGAFTMVSLTIGASAAQDFDAYRVRVYVASVLERTLWVTAPNTTYAVEDGNGNYTFDVAVRDKFGQIGTASSQTAPVELVDQTEFIADLRAGMSYRDSIPTTPATLDGLKDDDTSTNVVTYAASASAWRWTEGIRALEVRHRKSTLSTSASASYYYGVSLDGVTYTWYAGGTATGGVWAPVAQASEAAAKTAATTLAAGIWRITLAATVEARFFRLGHRNTTTSYALREFYPRSLVEADDINVESLSAISANLGTITAGTITGLTIQTATSGARVVIDSSGLKTYNSAGQLVLQATTTTDGALKAYTTAGVNYYTLGSTGGQIVSVDTGGLDTLRSYRIVNSLGTYAAGYGGYSDEFGSALVLDATGRTSTDTTTGSANIDIRADAASSSASSSVLLRALLGTGPETEASLEIRNNGASDIGIYANGSISTNSGLNVGTATGAVTGTVYASADGGGDYMTVIGNTVPTGKRGVYLTYDSVNDRANLVARHTGTADKPLIILSSALGFYGVAPVAKPTVTGSRGGNAALASVLTALANLGLITNSSSA